MNSKHSKNSIARDLSTAYRNLSSTVEEQAEGHVKRQDTQLLPQLQGGVMSSTFQ